MTDPTFRRVVMPKDLRICDENGQLYPHWQQYFRFIDDVTVQIIDRTMPTQDDLELARSAVQPITGIDEIETGLTDWPDQVPSSGAVTQPQVNASLVALDRAFQTTESGTIADLVDQLRTKLNQIIVALR